MLNALKISFLFIGAIIGAGFATGREISLYFAEANLATVLTSALLTGVFCTFFLFLGKFGGGRSMTAPTIIKKSVDISVVLCTFITFIAMCAGAETLFRACFGVPYVGLISGITAAVMSMFSMRALKNVNFLIVPAILILTVVLSAKTDGNFAENLAYKPYNALNHTAMNMMLGGFLIKNQGKGMKGRHIAASGVFTAVFVGAMLAMMYAIVLKNPDAGMPVFEFAAGHNLQYAAGLIIFLAIFSTQLGSGKILLDFLAPFVKNDWFAAIFICVIAAFTFNYDFKTVVDATYPVVGVVGILYLLFALFDFVYLLKGVFRGRVDKHVVDIKAEGTP